MVVVIRYEGPKGGPGMPEMLTPTSAIMGAGLGNDVALITDGRFSGGSHGFIIGTFSLNSDPFLTLIHVLTLALRNRPSVSTTSVLTQY